MKPFPNREISTILSITFCVFTLCNMRFIPLRSLMHDSRMKLYSLDYEIYPAENLPRILKSLELKQKLPQNNSPEAQKKIWSDSTTQLNEYQGYISNLNNEIKLYKKGNRKLRKELSKINSQNSTIGLLLILASLYFMIQSKRKQKTKS